jgi:hypothetical protein
LTLSSTSADRAAGADPRPYDAALSALRAGEVDSVVWDHSPIGLTSSISRRDGIALTLPVGYHGRDGVFVFSSLSELARHAPDEAARALGPALAAPQPYAPRPHQRRSRLRDAGRRIRAGFRSARRWKTDRA